MLFLSVLLGTFEYVWERSKGSSVLIRPFQMDWNLMNRHSTKPLLRRELVFKDRFLVYYLAVVVDLLLRFSWVLVSSITYLPQVRLKATLMGHTVCLPSSQLFGPGPWLCRFLSGGPSENYVELLPYRIRAHCMSLSCYVLA